MKPANSEFVSVTIPTYNERENIDTTLDRCSEVLKATAYEYKLIVIDDDSPDGTWEFVKDTYENDSHIRVLRQTEHRGLAPSIIAGFRTASMNYLVVIDGDLQYPPEIILGLLAALETGADLAIGSRYLQKGGTENGSRFRRFARKGATALAKLAVPAAREVSDPMSGFFAVRRSVIEDVEFEPQGNKLLLEILSRCEINRIEEFRLRFSNVLWTGQRYSRISSML